MICNIIIKRPTEYFNRPNTQFHNCDTLGKGVMFHEEIDNKNKIIPFQYVLSFVVLLKIRALLLITKNKLQVVSHLTIK